MRRDASSATRAIRSGPVTESAVFDVFDDITYTKGGAVLGMLEAWIGPDVFRRGLAAYIKGQQYSSATAGDLWHHMSAASGQDVSAVAASWTDQPGFPLLQVRAQCRQGATHVMLTQRRFSLLDATPSAQVWMTPVRLSRGNEVTSILLDAPQKSVVLEGCGERSRAGERRRRRLLPRRVRRPRSCARSPGDSPISRPPTASRC